MALANLLRNALDASPSDTSVELSVSREAAGLRFAVRDYGPGMSPETVARATEPFFTTKEAGHGMGLGLYLTQVLVERLGGRLRLESVPSQGTTASISLPG
jgi:two-component system sensor histidine kinase RegB